MTMSTEVVVDMTTNTVVVAAVNTEVAVDTTMNTEVAATVNTEVEVEVMITMIDNLTVKDTMHQEEDVVATKNIQKTSQTNVKVIIMNNLP
jgi:hypothetical protein